MSAVVFHGGSSIGRALALGLADNDLAVGVVGPQGGEATVADEIVASGGRAVWHTGSLDSRADFEAAVATIRDQLGSLATVVAPILPGANFGGYRALVDCTDEQWTDACEAPLRTARFVVQAAFTELTRSGGGRVVLVAPTAAISGAPNLAAYAAAAEGARSMVRVVARGWGSHGITLHWLGAPTALFVPDGDGDLSRVAVWDGALGRMPDARRDIAPVVAALASPQAAFLTGTTNIVDGGIVMPY